MQEAENDSLRQALVIPSNDAQRISSTGVRLAQADEPRRHITALSDTDNFNYDRCRDRATVLTSNPRNLGSENIGGRTVIANQSDKIMCFLRVAEGKNFMTAPSDKNRMGSIVGAHVACRIFSSGTRIQSNSFYFKPQVDIQNQQPQFNLQHHLALTSVILAEI